jgi:myb proto-oncogene protein
LRAGRKGVWTEEEVLKLKKAIEMHGDKDWGTIAALVPGRTRKQCSDKWYNALDPSIDLAIINTGKWTEDEKLKLKAAAQMYGGKDWAAIAAFVSGRTKNQCCNKWYESNTETTGCKGRWTVDEDLKLKAAAQRYGGKKWVSIAALVPGRTRVQCRTRWYSALDPSLALTAGRTGKWTEDEDRNLKDAVHMHGDKAWDAVAALVPGRSK